MLINQIIGRAWRLGQTEVVVVYNLVCDQTVDCLMTDYAQGKGSMSEQFLASRHGKGWFENPRKGYQSFNLGSTDIKKLLLSGRPPIEELPSDGAGAESTGDAKVESMGKRAGKGKSSMRSDKGESPGVGEHWIHRQSFAGDRPPTCTSRAETARIHSWRVWTSDAVTRNSQNH